jgi:hypothetical protein
MLLRSFVSTALLGLVTLAGSVACTGPAGSSKGPGVEPAPSTASVPVTESTDFVFDGRRLASWSSSNHGAVHVVVAVPGGGVIKVRERCEGSGELAVRVRGKVFDFDARFECDGRWRYLSALFPPEVQPMDPGPFPMIIDRPDTVTYWEVEAWALTGSSGPTPSTSS